MTLRDGWPAVSNAADQFDIRAVLRVDTAQDVSGSVKTGVAVNANSLSGLVTARSDMRVDVDAFSATLDRQGPVKLYNDGTVAVQLDAAPSANSRIDTVYVKQNEASSPISDSSDGPIFGKVTGVAGTSPVAPNIPDGAIRLADITIPSTATTTLSSGVTIVQKYPFTASAGGWLQFRNTDEMAGWEAIDGYRARLLDGTEYKRRGGTWVVQTQSADWTSAFGTLIHLERSGDVVTASGQASFNGNTGTITNMNVGEAANFPAWAWPKKSGNYLMLGNNSQVFSATIDGNQKTVKVSGAANTGYIFNVSGSWIAA